MSQQGLPAFNRITQLSGRRVWVRASSSYYESLRQLNWLFRELGLPPVYIETVPEYLQDGDLLEMVAAGIIPLTVTDSYKGRIWLGGMISGLKAHKLIPLRSNGVSAWALRKNSPELLKAVNGYLASVSRNGLYSDMTLRRLLVHSDQMSNILAPDPMGRLSTIRKVLEKYANKYDLDWLMLAGLGYKESGLNPKVRSHKGAVGIMQLLPSTGREVGINGARLTTLEGNVEAACRYLRLILDTYFNDPELDRLNRHLFALAAYNAGAQPGAGAAGQGGEDGARSQRLGRQRGSAGGKRSGAGGRSTMSAPSTSITSPTVSACLRSRARPPLSKRLTLSRLTGRLACTAGNCQPPSLCCRNQWAGPLAGMRSGWLSWPR